MFFCLRVCHAAHLRPGTPTARNTEGPLGGFYQHAYMVLESDNSLYRDSEKEHSVSDTYVQGNFE